MVSDPADYTWSSYRAHGFGPTVKMWRPHPEYLALGHTKQSRTSAYRQFFARQLSTGLITDIRNALNTGTYLFLFLSRDKLTMLEYELILGKMES